MRNQIEFYRSRGYVTVFVCVATHCSLVETNPDWQNIRDGILELGADQTFFAPIDNRRFRILKYVTWVEQLFRGTALDWIVFTGRSARLPDQVVARPLHADLKDLLVAPGRGEALFGSDLPLGECAVTQPGTLGAWD